MTGVRRSRTAGLSAVLFIAAAFACPVRAASPRASVSELPNGATLIVSEQPNLPIVLVRLLVDAGARRDPAGLGGLASLTADLLTEGTRTRSAAEISETIDFLGGALESSAGADYAEVSLSVLSKDLDAGLDLMADILLHPAFAAAELERRREAQIGAIRADRDNPTRVADKAFRHALFGDEPYGHPVEGSEESLGAVTRRDVQRFYERCYRPGGAVVVVVGDVEEAEARRRLERALGDWPAGRADAFVYRPGGPGRAQTIGIDKPVTQAAIVLGHRGVARSNPDFEAIAVMNHVLGGGGFSSRLMDNIRTRAGLAYSVQSFFTVARDPGSFQVVMQTKNASVADAVGRTRAEIERMRSEPISEEDLEDARRYLTGSFPLRLDSNAEIASFLAQTWFQGLGVDYADVYVRRVAAVTQEDVLRVAREYLHPDRLIEVVVADLPAGGSADAGGPAANP